MSDPSETFDWVGEAYERLEEAEQRKKKMRSGQRFYPPAIGTHLRNLASSLSKVEVMKAQGKEVPDMLTTLLSEEVEILANLAFHHLSIQARQRTEPTPAKHRA